MLHLSLCMGASEGFVFESYSKHGRFSTWREEISGILGRVTSDLTDIVNARLPMWFRWGNGDGSRVSASR